jgi:hypothetical protein
VVHGDVNGNRGSDGTRISSPKNLSHFRHEQPTGHPLPEKWRITAAQQRLCYPTTWPLAARAQQPGRVWRIGVLETTSMALNAANFEAFRQSLRDLRQSLRDLGYIEEQSRALTTAKARTERPFFGAM